MEPFSWSGKQVQFSSVTGKVVSSNKRSDTHVYSTWGGAGASAPGVGSSVVVRQEFFLLTDDGREVPIQLSGVDIPVRDGQTVTMIAGGVRADRRDNFWVRMAVHDTGQSWAADDDKELPHRWGLISRSRRFLILLGLSILGPILFVSGFISGALTSGSSNTGVIFATAFGRGFILGIIPWLLAVIYYARTVGRWKDLKNRLTAHLDLLSRTVLAAKPRVMA